MKTFALQASYVIDDPGCGWRAGDHSDDRGQIIESPKKRIARHDR